MKESLERVNIVLNPDVKYWAQLLPWIAKTDGWMFNVEDYSSWASTFEKFWWYFAIDKETDEPVGSVTLSFERGTAANGEEDVYCVGIYYVREGWRGTGIGTVLFNKVMAIAGENNKVLHGVIEMAPRYAAKYGFNKMPNYTHDNALVPTKNIIMPKPDPQYTIKDLKDVDEAKVIAYDAAISRRNRGKFLLKFMTAGECYPKVALDSAGNVVGLCSIRNVPLCDNTLSIGPFFTDNEAIARTLLAETLESIPDIEKFSKLDCLVPAFNTKAIEYVNDIDAVQFGERFHNYSFFKAIGGEHTKFEQFTQCAFTNKLLPTGDERVFGVLECSSSFI
ncbi:unnamed protein product [Cylicocyclus nassatus]|uniref:N-acetyltransferase domain-containing protein n=1 Tax=Cylicocyclus nassatus TaxID=53992 RepID=A0AA36DKQ5_CYLNA|nr:unnamed protein product [Cylicocyclus nassatus]